MALAFFNETKELTPDTQDVASHVADALLAHKDAKELLKDEKALTLLKKISGFSPFLTNIIAKYPGFVHELFRDGADETFATVKANLAALEHIQASDLMRELRILKQKASLLIALSDIAGIWPLEKVTLSMAQFAEGAVRQALQLLITQAYQKKELNLPFIRDPEHECGIFVLGMGKLGAEELNYSSDIDLIVLFDRERVPYTGSGDVQPLMNKMAQELVRLLQERTSEGYVFRVDLRLRPDPSSTPPAISVAAAMTYYETVGQNWERAAFIKARPIAGDSQAAQAFLKQLVPFIWRKYLDFAAIADIQSIKRQMDGQGKADITVAGHNIKTGLGGIREIEFFVQIHQLIWGGRIPEIRTRETCGTLEMLVLKGLVDSELAARLIESYRFLRHVEHRLQMENDQQTHTMPESEEGRAKLASCLEFDTRSAFEQTLLRHLRFVHGNFAEAFRGQSSLGSEDGKLSFTGVENDPQTVASLERMGFKNSGLISQIIQNWHRGSRRSTRTKRARELITELTPSMLKAFSVTADPDQAFMHFDDFLNKIPAGVQLFSLFTLNPQLLKLIALIMGSAPAMAETLSKNPALLDTVLTRDFHADFPTSEHLAAELNRWLAGARDFEDEIDMIRRFKNEKQFQAGVRLIIGETNPAIVCGYLSDIADVCLESMLACVTREFQEKHGKLPPDSFAIIVLGRLGARELTFGSDIDMVFVYDIGLKNLLLPPDHDRYNKLAQRFISALTTLTREGKLYEVDTRLRPSGKDGALVVGVSALEKYFREAAWTFELMAFTRARVISGKPKLRTKIETIVRDNIRLLRSNDKLIKDIAELRAKIAKEFRSDDIWNIKYARGGLMDLDFIAQYYVLLHGAKYPALVAGNSGKVFEVLIEKGLVSKQDGTRLLEAHAFLGNLFTLLRLCASGAFKEENAPPGLKAIVAKVMRLSDFSQVKESLQETVTFVAQYFDKAMTIEK